MIVETLNTFVVAQPAEPGVLGTMQDGALQLLFRWIHVVAGVLWIGLLYFFNWVNGPFEGKLDGPTKKIVVPELRPRALFFFRWGAAYTWISGILLLGLLYYHAASPALNGNFWANASDAAADGRTTVFSLIGLGLVIFLFPVYDMIAKALSKSPMIGLWVWYAVAIGFAALLEHWLHASGRSIYIHVGSLFGTMMAANVWMRIWPNQKKIITAIKSGQAPDAAWVGLAGLRSKHNTFMSMPLLLFMVSVHQTYMTGSLGSPTYVVAGVLVVGYLATDWIYKVSAKVSGM